jgi:DNA replication protein DnaC
MKQRVNLEFNLKELKLPIFLKNYSDLASRALENKMSYEQYLLSISDLEVEMRRKNKIKNLLKYAKFPNEKSLSSFDFSYLKKIKEQSVVEICHGHFLSNSTNIIFIGVPGSGKSHLAVAIGRELCIKNKKVLFHTGCSLVQELAKAKTTLSLTNFFMKLRKYDLIIIDELGYIPFKQDEAELLFQFISDRYERGSLLITTNLVFKEWGQVFKDPITASAAIDRLIHHSIIYDFSEEDSYRTLQAINKKNKKAV